MNLSYLSLKWDDMDYKKREEIAIEQAKKTVLYAKKHVPFYKHHYANLSFNEIESIKSLDEFAQKIPELTKEHLSSNSFRDFLPENISLKASENGGVYRNKGTGGTTGNPVTIIYSSDDWRAMSQHIARSIKFDFRYKEDELKDLIVFGLYHGDHVTNEIYRSGFELLGTQLFCRVSTKKNARENYKFFQEVKANALLGPPEDFSHTTTKGITQDNFFEFDAANQLPNKWSLNHNRNPEFKAVFWSSLPISEDFYNYINDYLNIPYQQAQYGSTEVCPTAASCPNSPRDFHLGFGPTLVLVKNPLTQKQVKDFEEGYVLSSKIGATDKNGNNKVPSGTFIINFRTGDYATLVNKNGKKCKCGRTTSIIRKVNRKEDIEIKKIFGCQVD